MQDPVLLEGRQDGVATLTLNRPTSLNAFNDELVRDLDSRLLAIAADRSVRVVLLKGTGRAFSAGVDIKGDPSRAPLSPEQWRERIKEEIDLVFRIWELPQPVVAAVHGYCLGLACDVAMACDALLAADDARFGEPEIRHASASTFLIMPFLVGLRKTKDLLLTGDTVDAETAARIGIASRVVPAADLADESELLARRMAALPETALRLNKAAINRSFELMGLRDAVAYNLEAFVQIRVSDAARRFDRLVAEKGLKAALKERDRAAGIAGGDT
jgi:enoyl-CoA hydratase/carnithine racemase